jgi:hypothetical protein
LWEVIGGSGGPITGTYPVLVPEIQNPPDHGADDDRFCKFRQFEILSLRQVLNGRLRASE